MNNVFDKTLPIFTGSSHKKMKFKNKITINKDISKDFLKLKSKDKKEKNLLDCIYCDFIKVEKQNSPQIDAITNDNIDLEKKIGQTIEGYKFKSPFRKL